LRNPLKRPKIVRPFDRPAHSPDADRRIRALALAALDRQQLERSRLARRLHDDVAQILSGAGLQLDILRMDLEGRVAEIASRTAEIQNLLDHVVRQIRDLSYELNPDIVERVGLQAALDLLVGRFGKLFQGSLRLVYDTSVRLPVTVAVAMERIAEEAVANAVRHARCTEIEIIVKSTPQGVVLEVRDNGCGFDCDQARKAARGLGLHVMEHCASKAGLQISITGQDKNGATVTVVAVT
jgi:two-component system NarL family sensor kinase